MPPECFEGGRGRDAPKISSKVRNSIDFCVPNRSNSLVLRLTCGPSVLCFTRCYSVRCIRRFLVFSRCDCLYSGIKPFGDGMSQEKMLQVMSSNARFSTKIFTLLTSQEGTMLRAATAGLTFPSNPKVAQRNHECSLVVSPCHLIVIANCCRFRKRPKILLNDA